MICETECLMDHSNSHHIYRQKRGNSAATRYRDRCDIISGDIIKMPTSATSLVGGLQSMLRKIDLTLSS